MKKLSSLSATALVIGAVCVLYYLICGIAESFTTPGLWIWIAFGMILFGGVFWKSAIESKIAKKMCKPYRIVKLVCLCATAVFLLVFLVFEGFIIGKWISGTESTDADTVIILGAAVEYDHPDKTPEDRINTAYDYLKNNPDAAAIACGGLGEGDIITEAECIKRELISMGIDADRITTEDRSTSTTENFRFAAAILSGDEERIAVITSGYHQFRAITAGEYIFKELGISAKLIPVSAPCASVKLPANMVREFAAFTKSCLSGDIGF